MLCGQAEVSGELELFAEVNLKLVMLGGRHLLKLAGMACWWACLAT
jgi:hypothetical protein